MALLSPALLWLLALAPILLFFYVWRARHRRFVTSTTLLWQQAIQETEHRASWRLPIRHILLLLQLLALALLALALARPAASLGVAHQRIVVLDTSLAMNAADVPSARSAAPLTRFAAAQRAVDDLISGLGPADSLSIVQAGPLASLVITSADREALRRALRALAPGLAQPALPDAMALARQLAARPGAQPTLTVLTSRPGGPALAAWDPCQATDLPCTLLRFGASDDDQAVTALSATCPPLAMPGDCSVFARIVNYGATAVREPLALTVDSLPLPLAIADATRALPPRSSLDLVFSAPRQARTLALSLGRHDILAADNVRWVALPHAGRRTVLVVSDDPTTLDRALRALPNVTIRDVTPGGYADAVGAASDLTVFDGWLPDGDLNVPALILGVPSGNSVFPSSRLVRSANVQDVGDRGRLAQALLGDVDLRSLLVARAPALHLPLWAEPLLSAAEGPLAFAGTRAPDQDTTASGAGPGARMVVLAFNLRDSNLPRLVAFPLFLAHAVDWLAGSASLAAAPGDALSLPIQAGAARLLDPTGHAVPLRGSADGSALFLAPQVAGAYAVRQGATTPQTLVVNPVLPANAESPAAAPTGAWIAAVASVSSLLARQEIWWAVALAVLALLTVEWYVYGRRT